MMIATTRLPVKEIFVSKIPRLSLTYSLVLALTISGPALTRADTPARYCESHPGFDQFDFWVGEWDVYVPGKPDKPVGHNSIEKRSNGCLIMESWTNTAGVDGYSLRHFNPATETWQMFWVSDGYTVKTEGGQVEPGIMRLEGEIHYFGNDLVTGYRVRFTANEDGTVRQFAEQFNPETERWDTWFDGLYKHAKID
jgi:hypothetical protein